MGPHTIGLVVLLGQVVSVRPPTTNATEITGPNGHAAAVLLRAIGSGEISSEVVSREVKRCAAAGAISQCRSTLRNVIEEIAETQDVAMKRVAAQGLQEVTLGGDADARRLAVDLASSLEKGTSQSVKSQGARPKWYDQVEGPPTAADRRSLAWPVYHAKLVSYVNRFLSIDPSKRIRDALDAATEGNCDTIYGGQVRSACVDLGIEAIQEANFALGLMDLRGSRGDPVLIDRYLSLDAGLLDRTIFRLKVSGDDRLSSYGEVLRRWREKRPNRWTAWADIEDLLGPP